MFFTNRRMAGYLMAFVLTAAVAHAQSYTPVTEGSTPTHRSQVDTWSARCTCTSEGRCR
jgi:hypothetical protein